jgi:hypothetical protein
MTTIRAHRRTRSPRRPRLPAPRRRGSHQPNLRRRSSSIGWAWQLKSAQGASAQRCGSVTGTGTELRCLRPSGFARLTTASSRYQAYVAPKRAGKTRGNRLAALADVSVLISPYAIGDMFVSLSTLGDRPRMVRANVDVLARGPASTAPGEVFRRKARTAYQAFNVHHRLWPCLRQFGWRTVYKYISDKLLHWFSSISLALGGVCFEFALIAAGYFRVAVVSLLSVTTAALLGWRPSRLWEIVSPLGVWYSPQGIDLQVWTATQSARKRADGA